AQQPLQMWLERYVALRGAETTQLLELVQLHTNERSKPRNRSFAAIDAVKEVCERDRRVVVTCVRLRRGSARFTQMKRLHLVVLDVREVQHRLVLSALFAEHGFPTATNRCFEGDPP